MNLKFYFLTLLFLNLSFQQCLDPAQPPRSCTQCSPTYILRNGTCFKKIRGCLNYNIHEDHEQQFHLVCASCQYGYVLQGQKCVRQAQANQNQDRNYVPPVYVEKPPVLKKQDLIKENEQKEKQKERGNDSEQFFLRAKKRMEKEYPHLAGVTLIERFNFSSSCQTKYHIYEFENGIKLVLEEKTDGQIAIIDEIKSYFLSSKVKEINKTLEVFGYQFQPLKAGFSINYDLQIKLNQKKDNVTINVDSKGQRKVISYQNSSQIENLKQQIEGKEEIQNNFTHILSQKEFDQSYHIFISTYKNAPAIIKNIEKSENETSIIYKIFFNRNQSATLSYEKEGKKTSILQYVVNGQNIIKETQTQNQVKQEKEKKQETKDEQKQQIIQNEGNETKTISEQQNVTEKQPQQQSEKGQNLETNKSQKQVQNQIKEQKQKEEQKGQTSEQKKQQNDEEETNNEVRKVQEKKQNDEVTSVVHEQGKEKIEEILQPVARKQFRSAEIINFLTNKSIIRNRYKLVNFSTNFSQSTSPIFYQLLILTLEGIQKITVVNEKEGELRLEESESYSDETCTNLNMVTDFIGRKIDTFLKSRYPLLKDFQHLFAQYRIKQKGQSYRLLYTNNKFKQIQIILQFSLNIGKYSIKKSLILNYGYEVTTDEAIVKALHSKAVRRYSRYLSEENGTQLALVMTNSSHARLYYTNQNFTYEYASDKNMRNSSGRLVILQKKKGSEVIPDGWNEKFFLTKEQQQKDPILPLIMKEVKLKYGFYFSNAPLLFVLKQESTYKIVLQTKYGYYTITGVEDKGSVSLSSFTKVRMVSKNSNCKEKLNERCVKCEEQFIEDSGRCYLRRKDCEIQLGNVCVSCKKGFVLEDKVCENRCSLLI